MAEISQEELDEILESHAAYLNGEPDGEEADFDDMDLSGLDFRGANLSGVTFSDADLSNADLSRCILDGSWFNSANFSNADLSSASFKNAVMKYAEFGGANLENSDFSNANLNGADFTSEENEKLTFLKNTIFTNADLSADMKSLNFKDVDFTGANLGSTYLRSSSFENCCFDRANIGGGKQIDNIQIRNCTFNNAVLRDVVFRSPEVLENCSFIEADLTNSKFGYDVVRNCDFSKAVMENFRSEAKFVDCKFTDTDLSKAFFMENVSQKDLDDILAKHKDYLEGKPDGIKADFQNMNLRGLNFRHADLSNVDFRGADLTGADLSFSNCKNCNFSGTNLAEANLSLGSFEKTVCYGTNFGGANLEGAFFSGADIKEANFNNYYNSDYDPRIKAYDLLASEENSKENHTNLNNAHFDNVKFEKVYMRNLQGNNINFRGAEFDVCKLQDSSFDGCDFGRCKFKGFETFWSVDLLNCNFENAELKLTSFIGKDKGIKNVCFKGADLTGSSLSGSPRNDKIIDCDFTAAVLKDFKIEAEYVNCDFSDANVSGATVVRKGDFRSVDPAFAFDNDFIVRNDLGKVSFDYNADVKNILLPDDINSERKLEKISQDEFDKIAKMHEAYLKGEPGGQKADLKNKDLSGIYFCDSDMVGYNLSGINLSHSNLNGAVMYNADLSGANMVRASVKDAKVSDCSFEGAFAYGSDWTDAEIQKSSFNDARMLNTELNAYGNMEDCSFKNANLSGSVISYDFVKNSSFENANLSNTDFKIERSMEFSNCNFDKANFSGSSFITEAQNCSFKGADFSNSNFGLFSIGNNFDKAVFKSSDLKFGYCLESSFDSARLYDVSVKESIFGQDTSFKNATFDYAYIADTKFNNCDMKGSRFNHSELEAVDFTASDLSGSSMHMLDIGPKVDLSSAVLTGVDADNKSRDGLPNERKTARFLQSTTGRTNDEGRGVETVQYRVFEGDVKSALDAARKEYIKNNSGKFAGNTQVVAAVSQDSKSSEGNYFVEVKANNVLVERVKPGIKKTQELGVSSKPVHLEKTEKKTRSGRSNEGR